MGGGQRDDDDQEQGTDGDRDGELHSFTAAPICWETTRLITSRRFSSVFSETNVFLLSAQPCLKLVERLELENSRTGVVGGTTNLVSSVCSKIVSRLLLSS